jgi:acetyl-CoA C-acetyltransferase
MKCEKIVVIDAARTAFGSFRGTLAKLPATLLGTTVVKELLERTKINPADIDEVIMGQSLQGGVGPNAARQVSIHAGIPQEIPSFTTNKACGSGFKAIVTGIQALRCEDAKIIIAGGQESMGMTPHVLQNSRDGKRMGDWVLRDSLLSDGLIDAFYNYHMGVTAENVAEQFNITRRDQDIFATESQRKAKEAMEAGRFKDEIVPIEIPQKKKGPIIFATDEHPKPNTTVEGLSKLKPAFKKDGTVTAGNASGVNDGAAALILTTAKKAKELGIEPLGHIVAYASSGIDPKLMGIGPIPASKKCLQKANWKVDDLELIESNEAFAAPSIHIDREMGWDTNIVNVNGGAIALGHPVAATGPRIIGTLLYEMTRRGVHKGLATMCMGGGMGIAMAIER